MLVGKKSNREINERKENQSERGGGKAENEGGKKQEYKKKGKVELRYK